MTHRMPRHLLPALKISLPAAILSLTAAIPPTAVRAAESIPALAALIPLQTVPIGNSGFRLRMPDQLEATTTNHIAGSTPYDTTFFAPAHVDDAATFAAYPYIWDVMDAKFGKRSCDDKAFTKRFASNFIAHLPEVVRAKSNSHLKFAVLDDKLTLLKALNVPGFSYAACYTGSYVIRDIDRAHTDTLDLFVLVAGSGAHFISATMIQTVDWQPAAASSHPALARFLSDPARRGALQDYMMGQTVGSLKNTEAGGGSFPLTMNTRDHGRLTAF